MSILGTLELLAANPSINTKLEILKSQAENAALKRVFELAYRKDIRFYTKNVELPAEYAPFGESTIFPVDALELVYVNICNRHLTGNAAAEFINQVLYNMTPETAEVVRRVILKDLRCGVTGTLANKVWKDLIPKQKVMLAETDPSRIKYPAESQAKEDGTRAEMEATPSGARFVSRNGNEIETLGAFDEYAQTLESGTLIDGELIAIDLKTGERLPRKVGNGIVNKAVKGTISPEEAKQLRFVVWDIPSMDDPYKVRLDMLKKMLAYNEVPCPLILVETKTVNNYEEALAHFKDCRRRGLEGSMLKNLGAKWQGKRTFDVVKFKAEVVGDFLVTGYELGTGKNFKRVGNLLVESQCGQVKCAVGIFKDMDESVRDELLVSMPKVVSILFNEIISSRDRDTLSLFLPRVVELRYDKDVGDTLAQLKELEKNAIN